MQVFNSKLVLVLELVQLFLWCLFVVLLVLCGWFRGALQLLANQENLAVGIIKILRLYLTPSQAAKFFNNPIMTVRLDRLGA
jgi:hypothetical protein